jgi:putative AlgH/UPF0301 family transcriptional regulator
MFLRKLRFFTILAATIALAPWERSNGEAKAIDPWTPNAQSRAESESPPPSFLPVQWLLPLQSFVPVQSKNANDLSAGKVLVASRDLADPNFAHTVVLLVRSDAQGVVGLVLNRRTDVPLSRALEGLKAAKDRSDRVYLGGPVDRPAVFALLQAKTKPEGAEHVVGGTYLIASKTLFEQTIAARPDPGNFHVYVGYAGWAKTQLKMEVALGAWFVFPADTQTIFSADPDSLWEQMIRKTEMKVAERLGHETSESP